jgi:para-aminobenzoate synthetase component 1
MQSTVVSERWTSRSADLDAQDFFDLPGASCFALLYGGGGRWIIYGDDPLLVLAEPDTDGLTFERTGDVPPIHPDLIGFIAYEYGYSLEPLLAAPTRRPFAFPDFHFCLHRRLRLFDRATHTLYEALRETPRSADEVPSLVRPGVFAAVKDWESDTPEAYQGKVARIREEIASGNVYQVNLSRQERWRFRGDITSFARHLYAANPAPFSALVAGAEFTVISSSPERFLRISGGRIEAQPIKGTAPRGESVAEDERVAEELLSSPKNRAELAMITDLLRNDLTRVCRVPSVRVDAFATLETYANVHHLVSTVSGETRADLSLTKLLQGVFPGGSITGCPKLAAMRLIRELEEVPRLVYTGALGWFAHDMSQLDFNIPIRTVWASDRELYLGVGGAVVWDSDPQEEYLETVHKGRSIVECLNS